MDPKKELKLIEDILSKINSKMTSEELISYALTKLSNYYNFTSCGIITYDRLAGDLKIKISKGLSRQFVKRFHSMKVKNIIEEVFKNEEPMLITDEHPHFCKEDYKFEHNYNILYITPLRIAGEMIGVIYFDSSQKDKFHNDDLEFFNDFANICSLMIDHTSLVEYISKTSNHDSLTGHFSYKYFHEGLDREMKRAKRAKQPTTLLLASIGHLGDYNSVFGHIAGDQAIIKIADIIKSTIRDFDIPSRYGNKFVVIFPDADHKGVCNIAQMICDKMDAEKFKGKSPVPTLRIGIASYPADGDDEKKLIMHAEKNLYESKRKGGNVYTY